MVLQVKDGRKLNGVIKSVEIEWTLDDGSEEKTGFTWVQLDPESIDRIEQFMIRMLTQ